MSAVLAPLAVPPLHASEPAAFRLGFGALLDALAIESAPLRILVVGGEHREVIAVEQRFPTAEIKWVEAARYAGGRFRGWPDAVILAYALSPQDVDLDVAVETAWDDLPVGGMLAAVDFHAWPLPPVARFLALRPGARLLPSLLAILRATFAPAHVASASAPVTSSRHFVFVGRKTRASGY